MSFKENLREEIEFNGILVKELAARVGISNSTMLSYIDSRGVLPNVETAVKIAAALGVTVESLVGGVSAGFSAPDSITRRILEKLNLCETEEKEAVLALVQKLTENRSAGKA